MKGIPIPRRMRTRPKDRRGYPVPFVVLVDTTGTPHFTVNDTRRVKTCISKSLCSQCGKRVNDGFWFVGGPRSFLLDNGVFLDPPSHEDCARYAVQVCPYLSWPKYTHRIDGRTLLGVTLPLGLVPVLDTNMEPQRPPLFMLARAESYFLKGRGTAQQYFKPSGFTNSEFWQCGRRLDDAAGYRQAMIYVNSMEQA